VQSITEGDTDLQSWTKAFSTGDYKKLGVTESTFRALRDEYNRNYSATQTGKSGQRVESSKDNFNGSQTSASVGAEAGVGVPGGGSGGLFGATAGLSLGTDHHTTTGANDNLQAGKDVAQDDSVGKSLALAKSFSTALQSDKFKNIGTDETRTLQHSLGVQRQYAKTLSESKSVSDVASEAVKRSSGFVALNAQIGGKEVASQMKTNAAYQRFQLNEGRAFGNSSAAQPYLDRARRDMKAGVTDRIEGDGEASEALARHRAAFLLAADEHAKPEDRLGANEYLLGSANAMIAARFTAVDPAPRPHYDIPSPTDHSGVKANALIRQVSGARRGKAGGKGANSSSQEPNVSERLDGGYKFATGVANDVETVANEVHGSRQAAEGVAAAAGLTDNDGPGTNHRAMSNIGANLTGDKSRTELPPRK
jgi:conjugal transfer mating pair stabilization protein TraG